MKLREEYTCPLELTHDIAKGKWKPIILWQLRLGNTSLASLTKDIQGINQKMLIEGVTDPDYCVLRFSAHNGRFYSNFNSEDFDVK